MSITIRKTHITETPYLYSICLKTAADGLDASHLYTDPYLVGQYYAAPYFFYDPSLCFVAVQNALPQGYILATEDTKKFNNWLEQNWLPILRTRYQKPQESDNFSLYEQNLRNIIHTNHLTNTEKTEELFSVYPAHLHIDLLPSLQGQGCGKLLIQTLFSELKNRACKGLHLGVSKNNQKAQAFYTKIGMKIISEEDWGYYFGILF